MKIAHFVLCLLVVGFVAQSATAVVLFSDNFNTNTSANWTKNAVPAPNAATQTAEFAFDYSPFGIPPAPGSADTLGLRLRANVPIVGGNEVTTRPAGVLSGLSMSPTGKNFGTNYKAEFYAWSNFFGAPNAQGLADNANSEGGTANVLFALGTSGNVPMAGGNPDAIAGSTVDGIAFATTGDAGIGSDFRAFVRSSAAATAASGVYAAGTANDAMGNSPLSNFNSFYSSNPIFAPRNAPDVQQTIATNEYNLDASNPMLGSSQAGSFGFAWRKVTLTKSGSAVTWDIDDVRIATVNAGAITLGGNNIALGVSDVNTTTARHPSLVFTVFDNLVVTDNPIVVDPLLGDYNNNGSLDAADYVVWRNAGPNDTIANDSTPGTVSSADYDFWKARFGVTSGAGSMAGAQVPEASTLVFALIAALYAVGPRRR
jgi:hypothetical protein